MIPCRTGVAGALLALACSGSPPTAPTGTNITLRVGESVSIAGTPLVLTFVRIGEDSRCPPDVTCIWSGNARVELDARTGGELESVSLNTNVGPREAVVGVFRVSLVELTPPPGSNVRVSADYFRATIMVVRTDGGVCTEEARPGLSVSVTDSLLGAAEFRDLSVVARDGDHRDSVFRSVYPGAPFNGPISLAYERAGTYDVTVRAQGYTAWTAAGVVVERDACHVVTVSLTARMAR